MNGELDLSADGDELLAMELWTPDSEFDCSLVIETIEEPLLSSTELSKDELWEFADETWNLEFHELCLKISFLKFLRSSADDEGRLSIKEELGLSVDGDRSDSEESAREDDE